jgi:hypothetical protein
VASSLGQFAGNMNRRADRLPLTVNLVKKEVARAAIGAVIDGTPVDTGEARSNWIVSLGIPLRGTIAPYRAYPKFSKGAGQGRGETANAAGAKARAQGPINAAQPGQTIIIQNNVDHIRLLNAGSSQQAPALFVQEGVKAGIRTLNGKTFKLTGP